MHILPSSTVPFRYGGGEPDYIAIIRIISIAIKWSDNNLQDLIWISKHKSELEGNKAHRIVISEWLIVSRFVIFQLDVLCPAYMLDQGLETTVQGFWNKFTTSFSHFIRAVLESLRPVYSLLSTMIRFRGKGTRDSCWRYFFAWLDYICESAALWSCGFI